MRYTLLLLDDDQQILDYLTEEIHKMFPDLIDIKSFNSFEAFMKNKPYIEYNFVITDVIFGRVNSIHQYDRITNGGKVPLVYMSGNDTRTFDIYDTPHEYFLAKPLDLERVKKALEKLMNSKEYLTFDFWKKTYSVPFDEIMYLESDRRVIHVVTKDTVYPTYGKLDQLCTRVPSYFIRVSKSYCVNKNYVKEHESGSVTLKNGENIIISRPLRGKLRNAF